MNEETDIADKAQAALNQIAFAPPRNPPPLAKAKEPFICTIIKIIFCIIAVRFNLTDLL